MSQNPQDSNFYDYNPEYGNLNQQNAQNGQYGQQQYQQPGQYGQPMILGVIGIFKANEAERYGAAASAGRIMSWINAVIGGLYLLFLGGFVLLGLIGIAGAASSSSSHFAELASTLALF